MARETMAGETRRSNLLAEGLWYLLLGGGALYLLAYAAIAVIRLRYPYHIEWMEGGSLHHVQWILAGHALYDRPTIVFTPYTYPPLYFYVSAAAALLFGDGFFPLRLVSFLSSLGCFGMLFLLVRRETASPAAGLLAAALFAATFKIGGAWFDLARVDSLFLLLLFGGIYYVRFGSSDRSAIAAAALLTLSYLTKQTALVMIPALVLGGLFLRPRRWSVRFIAALAVLCGLGSLLLDWIHHGWFRYYVFDLPAELPFFHLPVLPFLRRDLLKPMGIALAVGALYLASSARRPGRRRAALFYLLIALSAVATAYMGRNKVGGFLNALQPAYAVFALLTGMAAGELRAWLKAPTAVSEAPSRPAWAQALAAALSLACLAQLALLFYDPRAQLPSRSDRRAGDDLVRMLRGFDGEVLLPEFGYLASLAGKRVYAHSVSTYDVMQGKNKQLGKELLSEMQAAVREDRFAAILFAQEDWNEPEWLGEALADYSPTRINYQLIEKPHAGTFLDRGVRWAERKGGDHPHYQADQDVFLPLTGYQLRPVLLYKLNR